MKKYLGSLVVCFIALALADEIECVPGIDIIPGSNLVHSDRVPANPRDSSEPVWKGLEQMSIEERENSKIELVIEKNATGQAQHTAHRIEQLWNSGKFEEALAIFPKLATLTDVGEMAVGNTWRIPVPTQESGEWANDARIGNRDSIYIVNMDIHRASGNLFATLLFQQGSAYMWTVNLSTDGGSTWNETHSWTGGFEIRMVSTTVVGNYCYVAYIHDSNQTSARLRRFNATNGSSVNFPDGSSWIEIFSSVPPAEIAEVCVRSNQDQYNNRLYYLAITTDGELKLFWNDPANVIWGEIATDVANADRGLDVSWNESYADYFLVVSFFDTSNKLQIYGWDGAIPLNESVTDPSGSDACNQ
jgi:hypothetical protein